MYTPKTPYLQLLLRSVLLSTRAHLKAWYEEFTWPKMLHAQCGVWDYQVTLRDRKFSHSSQLNAVNSLAPHYVRRLVQYEEHLFSRKRRFNEIVDVSFFFFHPPFFSLFLVCVCDCLFACTLSMHSFCCLVRYAGVL